MRDIDSIELAYRNGYNEGFLEGHKLAASDYERGYKSGYDRGKLDAVKIGKWDKIDRDKHDVWRPLWNCSLCGGQKYSVTDFCPYCGAYMKNKE